jgi:hypothetical protein
MKLEARAKNPRYAQNISEKLPIHLIRHTKPATVYVSATNNLSTLPFRQPHVFNTRDKTTYDAINRNADNSSVQLKGSKTMFNEWYTIQNTDQQHLRRLTPTNVECSAHVSK